MSIQEEIEQCLVELEDSAKAKNTLEFLEQTRTFYQLLSRIPNNYSLTESVDTICLTRHYQSRYDQLKFLLHPSSDSEDLNE